MESSSIHKPLRFGCPACGIRLVVDQSIAGTEGPCPSCGARIVAPPAEVSATLEKKEAPPLEIKPREVKRDMSPGSPDAGQVVVPPDPEPVSRKSTRRRSVSPTTVISQSHVEKRETIVIFKILVSVLIVLAIVVGVYFYVKNAP